MPAARNVASTEVDLVVLRISADGVASTEDLARWAELAAQGFRVANVGGDASRAILFMERSFSLQMGHSIQLPAAIEAHAAEATQLRQHLMSELQARLQDQQIRGEAGGSAVPVERQQPAGAPAVPGKK
jgi:hypothetical protein